MEEIIKGSIVMVDLVNLHKYLEKMMEKNMARMLKLIQNIKEKLAKVDDVALSTHNYKDSAHVDKHSINKHTLREFYSNNGSNQGYFQRGLQIPKTDMMNFDVKDPIT